MRWYVGNDDIYRDLNVLTVTTVIEQSAQQYIQTITTRENSEAQLVVEDSYFRRLQRKKKSLPSELF